MDLELSGDLFVNQSLTKILKPHEYLYMGNPEKDLNTHQSPTLTHINTLTKIARTVQSWSITLNNHSPTSFQPI